MTLARITPFHVLALAVLILGGCGPASHQAGTQPPQSPPPSGAEWTVLVYMNGDNNLEQDSLSDFNEIAKVGSTDRVNVIVQYDRNGHYAVTSPQWDQTLRFRVTQGMRPVPSSAVEDIGEANMGDEQTLRDFVTWGKSKYPARRYALVIWDHGQGFRAALRAATRPAPTSPAAAPATLPSIVHSSRSFKSISTDETNGGDKLYNKEVTDALTGNDVDLLGFDACLMSMVETGYAMRKVAKVMVGSEELEPGSGWQYDDWLRALTANPAMDAPSLGKVLVQSYEKRYTTPGRVLPDTTLSAIDLSKAGPLADAVSAFSDALVQQIPAEAANIKVARGDCRVYAPDPFDDGKDYFFHIDIGRFAERVEARCQNANLRQRAAAVRAALSAALLANYAGADRQGDFGSQGLAIYFPATGSDFQNDVVAENGYDPQNNNFPVAFVREQRWVKFLQKYYQEVAP